MNQPLNQWCAVLQKLIKDSTLTTYGLARASGVPVQTIDRILAGAEPKLGTVERLSKVLGLQLAIIPQPVVGSTVNNARSKRTTSRPRRSKVRSL